MNLLLKLFRHCVSITVCTHSCIDVDLFNFTAARVSNKTYLLTVYSHIVILTAGPVHSAVIAQMWAEMKQANPSHSVCELGAVIGRMWRELTDSDKQPYYESFTNAKVGFPIL